ncbi:MAG: hypothetical protein HDS66_02390 [Bacteroidales bacterium]|nr:hypothetical protein [Bacteroidales bacterium]
MKRIIFMLLAVLISLSAAAFNFTGKTFRAVRSEDGITLTATIKFYANNRASLSYNAPGHGSATDPHALWEVSGDYVNIIDATGDLSVLGIDEDEQGVYLIMYDQNGYPYLVYREVKTAPKSGGAKRKTGKRR